MTPEAGWWRRFRVKHMSRGSRRFWKHCSAASCPESLLFCIQTGVGVGVLAYGFGYFAARKKYSAQSVE